MLLTVQDLCSDPCFSVPYVLQIQSECIHNTKLCFKFCIAMEEDLNGLMHVIPAVEDGLLQLLRSEWPVNVKGNTGLLDVVAHEAFHGLQAYRRIGHDIKVVEFNIPEHGGKLPRLPLLHNDPVIHFLGIQSTEDGLLDPAVIVPAVKPCPDVMPVVIEELLQLLFVVVDHCLNLMISSQICQDHQPVISECLIIVKNHVSLLCNTLPDLLRQCGHH